MNPEHVFISAADVPSEPVNDCWRFPDGENIGIAVENLGFSVTLNPDDTYTIDHHLYYDGPEGTCVSKGVYQTTAQVKLAETMESGPVLSLAYELTVGDDGIGSVTVEATPVK
ncbi:hypothetical protein [Haloferax sp. Atlit-6N]|uniref:hypothetical protein n=1 Tax=Haloferax sp. Atlit-6N TaxID=2077205 RepID=UPI0011C05B00|nr:hypothetical protein [Haloferax sp. Atlit-6N]